MRIKTSVIIFATLTGRVIDPIEDYRSLPTDFKMDGSGSLHTIEINDYIIDQIYDSVYLKIIIRF